MQGRFTHQVFMENQTHPSAASSSSPAAPVPQQSSDWLKKLLLCQSSLTVRTEAVALVEILCTGQPNRFLSISLSLSLGPHAHGTRRKYFLRYLTVLLEEAVQIGEKSEEFCRMYGRFIENADDKKLLASKVLFFFFFLK